MSATPVILTQTVEIDVGTGTPMGAYLARRVDAAGPAVIVAGELFGVSAHVREACEHLAESGYVAIAPDLYHRSAAWVELPEDEAGRARGFQLLERLTRTDVLNDLNATLKHLVAGGASNVAMLGLSVGGHVAYLAAAQLPIRAAAILYGGWLPVTDIPLSRPRPTLTFVPRAPVLYLVGEQDQVIPPEHRRQIAARLRAAGQGHELVEYPRVGHGFLNRRRATYSEDAARDAWGRIEAFYRQNLT